MINYKKKTKTNKNICDERKRNKMEKFKKKTIQRTFQILNLELGTSDISDYVNFILFITL